MSEPLEENIMPDGGSGSAPNPSADSKVQGGALSIRRLRKRFGSVTAVEALDLEMSAGEFVSLLGPSGSGKTTTLALVAGFQRPDAGSIHLSGRNITQLPTYQRNIGLVFQNYALFPHMSVEQNVGYPLRMRRVSRAERERRVADALQLVQLSGLVNRYPRELSGGQQQRVAVARATVYQPPLLLMDEPLSALDKALREDMQIEIRAIHRDLGTSILYVTHDQEEALGMSDRIVLMNHGRVVQIGTPQEIYTRPSSLFAASFIGHSNFLKATVEGSDGSDLTSVRLSNGALIRATPSQGVSPGQSVLVLIRPEDIRLGDAGSGEDQLGVRLTDVRYFGKRYRCQGRFETGDACTLEISPSEGLELIESGVGNIRWISADAVIIPTDGNF